MSLTSGTRLGPYEIVDQIGAGGMGEVYKATDTRLNRTIAIKVLPEHLAGDPQRLARFQREAQTISSLNHPHICALHDVGDENGTHFLVMEYVEGEALDQRLEKGPVPLDDALEYSKQIADALEKAHQQGIVHRDLKPANVMITKAGVKLIDFGLVHLTAESPSGSPLTNMPTHGESELTAEGTILGTFRYMAPEQVEGQEVDSRTDIYALCLVIYEMITGKRAIDGDTQASLIAAILKDKPQPLTELQPITPPQLDRVVQTGLEKDPDKRWQSAREVKHALEWIGLEAAAVPVVDGKHSPVWKVATAAFGLVALLAVVWALWPEPAAQTRIFSVPMPDGQLFGGYLKVAPDGQKLALVTASGIWVRDFRSSVDLELLAGTAGANSFFWSPDSRSIGFGVGSELKRVDLDVGQAQTLVDAGFNVGSGDWNRNGVIVFGRLGAGSPLYRVPATGADAPIPLTVLDELGGVLFHSQPSFLPDGRRFIYFSRSAEQNGLFVGSLDVAPEEQSTEMFFGGTRFGAVFAADHLFYISEAGTLVAQRLDAGSLELSGERQLIADRIGIGNNHGHFSVTDSGVVAYRRLGAQDELELTRYDREGEPRETIALVNGNSRDPSLSADGSWAAVGQNTLGGAGFNIFLIDLTRNNPRQLTANQVNDSNPMFGPDGRIVFRSARSGSGDLYVTNTVSVPGDEELLLGLPENQNPTDWSVVRSIVLFDDFQSGADYDILALPIESDGSPGDPIEVVATEFDESGGRISPDGNWIAYQRNTGTVPDIYVEPFPPEPGLQNLTKVSQGGGAQVSWGSEGSELFYLSLDDGMLMNVPIELPSDKRLLPSLGEEDSLFTAETGNRNIASEGHQYAVSQDGQEFLMLSGAQRRTVAIEVILNWAPDAE